MCARACVFLPKRVPMAEPLNVLPVRVRVCVCVRFRVCVATFVTCGVRACFSVCDCACVCVSVYVRAHVRACSVYEFALGTCALE